jgi:hypothetical protein
MVFPVIGGDGKPTGYEIDNSLRFNEAGAAELTITPSSAGNRRVFTFSCWVKRSGISNRGVLFRTGGSGDSQIFEFIFHQSDYIMLGLATVNVIETNALFRDPSAWYHIVLAVDTTDGTASNRVKLYVNGQQNTSWSVTNLPSQNHDYGIGRASTEHTIGASQDGGDPFEGYMADVHYIDGIQYAASDFGETNDNGVWIPKKFTGSFGSNGFKLEFQQTGTSQNSSGIGADTSGNDNHMAVNNLTATDVTTDTPTNNFATLNPINGFSTVSTLPVTTEGNLQFDSNSSNAASLVSTIAPSNGKWYVEVKALTSTTHIGVSEVGLEAFNVKGQGASRPNINYQYGGGVEIDGSIIDNEATFTSNDILGFALNLDDGELIIYKNGTALNSGTAYNLHTNTTHGNTGFSVQTATGSGNTKASFNFGNPAFAISSGNADANGYGNFEYSVPSGYFALCTKNLAEYG